jgi:hypothetical protein
MTGEDWIRRELAALECVECGRAYDTAGIHLLARRDGLYFVDLSCAACGTRAVAVVGIEHDGGERRPRVRRAGRATAAARRRVEAPPVSADDVLEMHRFLDEFDGDFRGLFRAGPAEPGARDRE